MLMGTMFQFVVHWDKLAGTEQNIPKPEFSHVLHGVGV